MTKRSNLLLTSALAVTLGVAVSGCTAGAGQVTLTGNEIVQKVRDTMNSAQSVQGTVELTVNINKEGLKTLLAGMMPGSPGGEKAGMDPFAKLPDTVSASFNVWGQQPDKGRIEGDVSTIPGVKGATLVSDGQKIYALDPTHQKVYTVSRSKLESLKDEMQDKMAQSPMSGMLQGYEDPEAAFNKIMGATDVKVVGTEKLGDKNVYKLEATPKADAATLLGIPDAFRLQAGMLIKDAKATIWVDSDRFVPLKATIEHPNMGSVTYNGNLELNGAIDADKFVLQVPAGYETIDMDAKIDSMKGMEPKSTTLAEAREAASKEGWKLLEPGYLPEGATLVGVEQSTSSTVALPNHTNFKLRYSSSQADFEINQTKVSLDKVGSGTVINGGSGPGMVLLPPFSLPANAENGADVSASEGKLETSTIVVRSVPARMFVHPNGPIIEWQEKDSELNVLVHGNFTLEEAIKIAEGLK